MNRDDIIRMAREAGIDGVIQTTSGRSVVIDMRKIERFAALVAAAEREESIKLWASLRFTDEQISDRIDAAVKAEREVCAELCELREDFMGEHADRIRARGETK